MKIKSIKFLLLIFFLASLLSFKCCKCGVVASVKCGEITQIESDFGVLNLANFSLGTILELDPVSKIANRILTVDPDPANVRQPNPELDEIKRDVSTRFDIVFDVEVPEAVKANIKKELNSNVKFVLTKAKRIEITDPLKELLNSPRANDVIKARMEANPDHYFLFVNAHNMGKELKIQVEKSNNGKLEVNVFKYGKYSVVVSFLCQDTITGFASESGAWFWKYNQIKYDFEKKSLDFDNRPLIKAQEYNFSPTVK